MPAIGPGPAFAARLGGDLFDENRENGTPLQTNSTDLSQLRAAIEGQAGQHELARDRSGSAIRPIVRCSPRSPATA